MAIAGIATFTAACGSPSGSPSAKATTSWSSANASRGSSTVAPGLGLYDGKSGPAGIETAAKWLGSSSSIKYAGDFIDATNWSNISAPW